APVVATPATASGAENALSSFAVHAVDPDGDTITSLDATGLPGGANFTPDPGDTTGTFSWTPSFSQAGAYTVTFTAANALSGSGSTALTITNLDRAPVVIAPSTASAVKGSQLAVIVTATDPDVDAIASLSANLTGLPAGSNAAFTANPSKTS